jgi:hypothetical protein
MPMPNPLTTATPRELEHGPLLSANPADFARDFNVKSFMFRHALADHPLFTLPRLATLADRTLEQGDLRKFVALGGKTSSSDAKFATMQPREKLSETIRQLGEAGAWLKITSANAVDPAYEALLQQLLQEIEALAAVPLRQEITWSTLTVFMASPHIVTPYHIDHESNFLFQISGQKQLTLFDPNDRGLLSENEIENFYRGDFEAAQWREELQLRGSAYQLVPGAVVHHPPLAPHWVQNGDNISISVSIGFCMQSLDRRARIYQVNHFLRRFGLQPSPPGRSRLRDRIKIAGIGMISKSSPKTPEEILFSGTDRLLAPRRVMKKLAASLRRGHV